MKESRELAEDRRRTRQRVAWLVAGVMGLCVVVGVPCALLPLGAVAVYERVIPPPTFSVKVGATEFAAPCPPSELICDEYPPFFALWRGDQQPDGSVEYRQLIFIYLNPKRQR